MWHVSVYDKLHVLGHQALPDFAQIAGEGCANDFAASLGLSSLSMTGKVILSAFLVSKLLSSLLLPLGFLVAILAVDFSLSLVRGLSVILPA